MYKRSDLSSRSFILYFFVLFAIHCLSIHTNNNNVDDDELVGNIEVFSYDSFISSFDDLNSEKYIFTLKTKTKEEEKERNDVILKIFSEEEEENIILEHFVGSGSGSFKVIGHWEEESSMKSFIVNASGVKRLDNALANDDDDDDKNQNDYLRVAVFLCSLDGIIPECDKEQISKLLWSNYNPDQEDEECVDKRFFDDSFGKLVFSSFVDRIGEHDIFGPFVASVNGEDESDECDFINWRRNVLDSAEMAGINLSLYRHFVFVFPYSDYFKSVCTWIGLGNVGCGAHCSVFLSRCDKIGVYMHELGHNFGLHDGNSNWGESGNLFTYGDISSIMGNEWVHSSENHEESLFLPSFSAPEKIALGLIDSSEIIDVNINQLNVDDDFFEESIFIEGYFKPWKNVNNNNNNVSNTNILVLRIKRNLGGKYVISYLPQCEANLSYNVCGHVLIHVYVDPMHSYLVAVLGPRYDSIFNGNIGYSSVFSVTLGRVQKHEAELMISGDCSRKMCNINVYEMTVVDSQESLDCGSIIKNSDSNFVVECLTNENDNLFSSSLVVFKIMLSIENINNIICPSSFFQVQGSFNDQKLNGIILKYSNLFENSDYESDYDLDLDYISIFPGSTCEIDVEFQFLANLGDNFGFIWLQDENGAFLGNSSLNINVLSSSNDSSSCSDLFSTPFSLFVNNSNNVEFSFNTPQNLSFWFEDLRSVSCRNEDLLTVFFDLKFVNLDYFPNIQIEHSFSPFQIDLFDPLCSNSSPSSSLIMIELEILMTGYFDFGNNNNTNESLIVIFEVFAEFEGFDQSMQSSSPHNISTILYFRHTPQCSDDLGFKITLNYLDYSAHQLPELPVLYPGKAYRFLFEIFYDSYFPSCSENYSLKLELESSSSSFGIRPFYEKNTILFENVCENSVFLSSSLSLPLVLDDIDYENNFSYIFILRQWKTEDDIESDAVNEYTIPISFFVVPEHLCESNSPLLIVSCDSDKINSLDAEVENVECSIVLRNEDSPFCHPSMFIVSFELVYNNTIIYHVDNVSNEEFEDGIIVLYPLDGIRLIANISVLDVGYLFSSESSWVSARFVVKDLDDVGLVYFYKSVEIYFGPCVRQPLLLAEEAAIDDFSVFPGAFVSWRFPVIFRDSIVCASDTYVPVVETAGRLYEYIFEGVPTSFSFEQVGSAVFLIFFAEIPLSIPPMIIDFNVKACKSEDLSLCSEKLNGTLSILPHCILYPPSFFFIGEYRFIRGVDGSDVFSVPVALISLDIGSSCNTSYIFSARSLSGFGIIEMSQISEVYLVPDENFFVTFSIYKEFGSIPPGHHEFEIMVEGGGNSPSHFEKRLLIEVDIECPVPSMPHEVSAFELVRPFHLIPHVVVVTWNACISPFHCCCFPSCEYFIFRNDTFLGVSNGTRHQYFDEGPFDLGETFLYQVITYDSYNTSSYSPEANLCCTINDDRSFASVIITFDDKEFGKFMIILIAFSSSCILCLLGYLVKRYRNKHLAAQLEEKYEPRIHHKKQPNLDSPKRLSSSHLWNSVEIEMKDVK